MVERTGLKPVRLDANGGLEASAMLASLAAHSVPGAERTDLAAGTHERLIRTAHGPVAASVRLNRAGAEVSLHGPPGAAEAALDVIRRWLDLDTNVAQVEASLRADPLLAPLVEARPALRVIGTTDAFQTAVTTVLGQQVSLAAGRTFASRLVQAYGRPGPRGLTRFPDALSLAQADSEELRSAVGLTASRARTVLAVAHAFADHAAGADPGLLPLTRGELLSLPGVGPWTADYLEVRTGHHDAFAPGDLVLRRSLGGITSAEAAARAAAWSPFRAYALVHLWTASAYL